MAQPFVRGPVHVFYAVNGSASYLGTGERAPRVAIRRCYAPVNNDLTGVSFPFDYAYEGAECWVTLRLTRWNEVVQTLIADPVFNTLAGVDVLGSIGTLMVTEGAARQLWLLFTYGPGSPAVKAAMATQPAGFRFPFSFLDQEASYEGGTDPASVTLSFHCVRGYNPSTGAFGLFDSNMSGLPTIN